jgi:tRNA (cmo5U34)-methyltransferase
VRTRGKAVGDAITAANARWSFADVSEQFDEHVSRSVPLYREGHQLIARMADFFLPDGSTCYDLGCATGQLLRVLAERNAEKDVRFVGVDVEPAMARKAADTCAAYPRVEIVQGDLLDVELPKTDVVVAYYTVQFVRPRNRQTVVDRIYESLNWGGAFFCFEKVRGPDARFQDILTGVYTEFKLEQGYSPEEIVGKAESLKGILEPFSTDGNLGLFERSGFVDVMTIFKYACFEGFLAIK